MAGINFNSNSFQLRATSLKKANVAPEAQKKEEEVKAGSEEKKPVIKTKIQNSSLNLLGNYNMVSVNTTAKKSAVEKTDAAENTNETNETNDKKVDQEYDRYYNPRRFMRLYNKGKLDANDWTIFEQGDKYVLAKMEYLGYRNQIGVRNQEFDSREEALKARFPWKY